MKVLDVSKSLGEYMLKGWVLTDEICPKPGCQVPLMRSPSGIVPVTMFCANCDEDPNAQNTGPPPTKRARKSSGSATSSSSSPSRASTPPTDIPSRAESPEFTLPPETPESARRREQSDAAATEIGVKLLKGWAMLADVCPNEECYGVPLVRPPGKDGKKDMRKECVICYRVYIDDKDAAEYEGPKAALATGSLSDLTAQEPPANKTPSSTSNNRQIDPKGKRKQLVDHDEPSTRPLSSHVPLTTTTRAETAPSRGPQVTADNHDVTSEARSSLECALRALSQRMVDLVNNPSLMDPSVVGQTADAMGKVVDVLGKLS